MGSIAIPGHSRIVGLLLSRIFHCAMGYDGESVS